VPARPCRGGRALQAAARWGCLVDGRGTAAGGHNLGHTTLHRPHRCSGAVHLLFTERLRAPGLSRRGKPRSSAGSGMILGNHRHHDLGESDACRPVLGCRTSVPTWV